MSQPRQPSKRWVLWVAITVAAVLFFIGCTNAPSQQNNLLLGRPAPVQCHCLVVIPFENLSNITNVGRVTASLLAAEVPADQGISVFPPALLGVLLNQLKLGEAEKIDNEIALGIAQLLNADGVLVGTIGGHWGSGSSEKDMLWIVSRLSSLRTSQVQLASATIVPEQKEAIALSAAPIEDIRDAVRSMLPQLMVHPLSSTDTNNQPCWVEAERFGLSRNAPTKIAKSIAQETAVNPPASLTGAKTGSKPLENAQLEASTTTSAQATPIDKKTARPLPVTTTPAPTTSTTSTPPTAKTTPAPMTSTTSTPPTAITTPAPTTSTTSTPPTAITTSATTTPDSNYDSLLNRLQAGEPVILPGVGFNGRTKQLKPINAQDVRIIGLLLLAQPTVHLEVRVHTDSGDSPPTDQALTQEQAAIVVSRLAIIWKVNASRLKPVGLGSSQSIQPNITKKGREKNRRVELLMISGNK